MKPADDIEALRTLDLSALRQAWRTRFGGEPPRFRSRELLLRTTCSASKSRAWRLQAPAQKRLTELAERFAADPAFDPAPRTAPSVGSALVRDWNGVRHIVLVTLGGFQYLDKTYPSLTQVAKAISGKHQSGPRFFGLVGADIERGSP